MLDAATCPKHLGARAAGSCERCGTFGCTECLDFRDFKWRCRDCLAREGLSLPSLRDRATLARAAIGATAGVDLLQSRPAGSSPKR